MKKSFLIGLLAIPFWCMGQEATYFDHEKEQALVNLLLPDGLMGGFIGVSPFGVTSRLWFRERDLTYEIRAMVRVLGGWKYEGTLYRVNTNWRHSMVEKYEQKLALVQRLPIENEPLATCIAATLHWMRQGEDAAPYHLNNAVEESNTRARKNNRVAITKENQTYFALLAHQLDMLLLAQVIKSFRFYT
ncbi:MAG: hypothetical protein WCE21_02640 [Candidatus Babeliales bacterium]